MNIGHTAGVLFYCSPPIFRVIYFLMNNEFCGKFNGMQWRNNSQDLRNVREIQSQTFLKMIDEKFFQILADTR